jgi:hypothetical protein
MNTRLKYFSTSLLAMVALLVGASPASAQVALGAASGFAVLGGSNVTCTAGSVVGDVGVAPGTFVNTGCTITGAMPPATNAAAARAQAALASAYAGARKAACTGTLLSTITTSTLAPGVYCTDGALTATDAVLTLDARGDRNAVWIFKTGAALTGTNFTVVMANGGQPCNVFWAPSADVTMTTSALKGNILAGAGSITFTGGSLAGRALAKTAITMTGTGASVIGCGVLSGSAAGSGSGSDSSSCKGKDDDDRDDDDKDHKKHGDDDKDRGETKKPYGDKKRS